MRGRLPRTLILTKRQGAPRRNTPCSGRNTVLGVAILKIVNLTPHAISVVGDGACTLPPSGQVARVSSTTAEVRRVNGIPCYAVSYGEVQGLPEAEEDTLYVVSALVRAAVPHRTDVASPGELVRDNDGKPIGCRGLAVNG